MTAPAALSDERVKLLLQRYVDHINAGDLDKLVALFAEDAVVEDPIGAEPKRGRAAIRDFYRAAFDMGVRIEVDGPMRGSQANVAAMAFTVTTPGVTLRAIEMMTFGEDERIMRMVACFGPSDITRR
ncbi:MAG: SnoaL-like domain-containing protein [Rhodospirillales bacterium]|nr:SnoaL-like domain-containing protein [Rhodospirillales bacterium]